MVKSPNEKRKEHDRIFNTIASQQKGIQVPMFTKEKQEKIEPPKPKVEAPPKQDEPDLNPQDLVDEQPEPESPVEQAQARTPEQELNDNIEFDLEALFPETQDLEITVPELSEIQPNQEADSPEQFTAEEPQPFEFDEPTFSQPEEQADLSVEDPLQELQSLQEPEPEFDIVKERQFRQEKIRQARLKMQGRFNPPTVNGLPAAPNDVFDFDLLEDINVGDNQPNPKEEALPLMEGIEEQMTDVFENIVSILEKLADSQEKANIRLRQIEARIDKWGDI